MAKLSSINKNERRKKLVKKYAAKYAKLKAIANDESLDEAERLIARLKLAEIPRNGNPTRVRNRCATTGRPRGYYRKFGLNRIELKYFEGEPAIKHVSRVSKPGRRVYSGSKELPNVRNGLGITIVSTPRGVLSDAEARAQNVGGEVLAEVF